jgi:uncharacterized protein (UPF0333 family)
MKSLKSIDREGWHKGIAMIELIFALVVMGIVMLSIPNMLHMASSSGYTSLQQEAIASAAANINLTLSREWDEADTNATLGAPILDTGGSLNLTTRAGGRARNYRTPLGNNHLQITTALGNANDNDVFIDDIDDLTGVTTTLLAIDNSDIDSVDQNITLTTTVRYLNDTETTGNWSTSRNIIYDLPGGVVGTSNIKEVRVRLRTSSNIDELDKDITLQAFSCNIGSFERERVEL